MDKKSTILLVEDNAEVLKAIRTTLLKSGYWVLSATSGDAAMKIFNDEPVIDLLLTDIVMPGELQGTTLARATRDLRPDLPVIFMSGYAREATVHGNGLRPEDIRLMKPVRREELLSAISKALLSGDGSVIKS
jgi:CheY-like chemotaxis protein